jgi:hypothetical protein
VSSGALTRFPSADAGVPRWIFPTLLVLGGAATTAAAIVGNGSVIVAVAPVLAVAALAVVWVVPLRIPLFVLIFLGLALDATDDGPWNSPVAPLGRLLVHNLNKTIPVDALALPGMALIVGFLLVIHAHRRMSASRVDGPDASGAARPLIWAL